MSDKPLTDAQLEAMRQLNSVHYRFMRYPAMAQKLASRGYLECKMQMKNLNMRTGKSDWGYAYRLTEKGVAALQPTSEANREDV